MTAATLVFLALFIPFCGTILVLMSDDRPNQREGATLATGLALFAVTLTILGRLISGETIALDLVALTPEIKIAFRVEPLGMLFALVASTLWIVNSLYAIGYMRGNREKKQTRFYACFPIAIMGAMGVAYAANLVTLFIFYEVLTLSTYPLVVHKETREARRGARIYLGVLLTSSIGLLLPAVIWAQTAAGTGDFTAGGVLAGHLDADLAPWLLALFMFGIGKAALIPMHPWLPNAMVAPTPVSALLHAVAVVKAGVFTVLKVTVYVFGIDFLAETGASQWLIWAACFSILAASLVAMTKDNLKARLAYSTVSQLGYVTLGAALATSAGVMGGAMQIAMHAMGKITLFFCAGAIYVAVHKTEVSQLDGLAKKMPLTMAAFLIGALSIIGMPPMGGAWAKYWLLVGSAGAGMTWVAIALLISSVLNVLYLAPIAARAFYRPPRAERAEDHGHGDDAEEAAVGLGPAWMTDVERRHWLVVLPPVATAIGTVALFFCAGFVQALIAPILGE